MKRVIILLLFFFSTTIFSQELLNGGQPELYLDSCNIDENQVFMKSINIAESCDHDASGGPAKKGLPGKPGWGFCPVVGSNPMYYLYTYGVYLIYEKINNHYFYFDIRDKHYPADNPDQILRYKSSGYSFNTFFRYKPWNNETEIQNCPDGSVKQIWKARGYSLPDVENFPSDYFENSIGICEIDSSTDGWIDGEPLTIFYGKAKNNDNITMYRLYRAYVQNGVTPSNSDYVWINEDKNNKLYFQDKSAKYNYDNYDNKIFYYVEAYSGNTLIRTTVTKSITQVISD